MNVTTAQTAAKGESQPMSHVTSETATPVAVTPPDQPDSQPKKPKKATPRKQATKKTKQAKKAAVKAAVKAAKKTTHPPAGERQNKKAEVMALMRRSRGATLAEIMAATGWQKHTVRGFVSILGKKGGVPVESSKNSGGERTYKIGK
jgi:hypothetical protein